MSRIRKLFLFTMIFFSIFLFVGCTPSDNIDVSYESQAEGISLVSYIEEESIISNDINENTDKSKWCPCGMYCTIAAVWQPTPPLNISAVVVDWSLDVDEAMMLKALEVNEFVKNFVFVHQHTFRQRDNEWVDSIILWPDETLRDFFFVSLHYDGGAIFSAAEVLLAIDELPSTHAVVLNVAFSHHRFPFSGIIFTDENGGQRRMFINSLMYVGGCNPSFHLVPLDDSFFLSWAIWE